MAESTMIRPVIEMDSKREEAVLKSDVKVYATTNDIPTKQAWAELVQKGLEVAETEEDQ